MISRRKTSFVAIGVFALGLVGVFSQTAQATSDPPVVTVAVTRDFPEGGRVDVTLDCPMGTGFASLDLTTPSTPSYDSEHFDGDVDVSGMWTLTLPLQGFVPGYPYDAPAGLVLNFAGQCFQDDTEAAVLGTASITYTVPNYGMTVSTPGSTALGDPILVSINCGTPPASFVQQNLYVAVWEGSPSSAVYTSIDATGPVTNAELGSPASYGFSSGDTFNIDAACLGTQDGLQLQNAANRITTGVVGPSGDDAPVVPVDDDPVVDEPAPVPVAALPQQLSYTGANFTLLPFAFAFLLAGSIFVSTSRRGSDAS